MGEAKRKKKSPFRIFFEPKILLSSGLIVICVGGFFLFNFAKSFQKPPLEYFDPARSKGVEEAPVHIVEFIDFQCSHCAAGSLFLKDYFLNHPDNIYLTIKYFPLRERNSEISALYAQCAAAQEKFWPFHDRMMLEQTVWRESRDAVTYFQKMARDIGIDVEQLEKCSGSSKARKVVFSDRKLGDAHFVKSTPTYFVNGEMIVGVDELKGRLKELLK